MKFNKVILALICMALVSCFKAPNVKPNIQTTVSGQFYDNVNNEGYANATVKVGEYESHFAGELGTAYTLIGYRGTTTTDINGKYTISFTASGNGNTYFLEYVDIPQKIYVTDNNGSTSNSTYSGRSEQIQNLGSAVTYNFTVFKQYFMKTRIIVQNNPMPPLGMSIGGPQFSMGCSCNNVSGANNDTVVYIQIKKNTGGFYLNFGITNPITGITLNNTPKIFINPTINQDTISGGTYTVLPATFK
jgi:hypothetical protein